MDLKNRYEQQLESAGTRVTAMRLLVWRTLNESVNDAFSLIDVENALPTVERSTIFRTLTLLTESHMLHCIDDGSGMQKYCVCHCSDTHHHVNHVHLTCLSCGQTVCLHDVTVPAVPLPEGFEIEEAEYVVKGYCKKCATKMARRG